MKTKEANQKTLSGKKLVIYVACVAAICFLNSVAIQASDYDRSPLTEKFTISDYNPTDPQTSWEVQEWLTNFNYQLVTFIIKKRAFQSYYKKVQSGEIQPKSMTCAERHGKANPRLNKFGSALYDQQ